MKKPILSLVNKQFIKAAQDNQLDELKNLLIQGADVHANDDKALRNSAFLGHLEIVKFLVIHGANIHAQDDFALIFSAFNDRLEIVKFLLSQGANIHAQDDGALRLSAQYGRREIVKFLLIQGANIHANSRWQKLKLNAQKYKVKKYKKMMIVINKNNKI